jgi:hypothetical protein
MRVISANEPVSDLAAGAAFAPPAVHRQRPAHGFPCPPVLAVFLILLTCACVVGAIFGNFVALQVASIIVGVVLILLLPGLVVVQPNEARVLIFVGRYVGTLDEARLWWVNPLTVFSRPKVSLQVQNFQSERIKVNDASGNPIEIAAVVVWRVVDTGRAMFDVQDFKQFVSVQSETAIRHLAGEYPYDDYGPDTVSLRTNAEEVRGALQAELQARLETAGVEVVETRLTHLAYAPEIAEVMLRRQQAEAILAARRTLVSGAVGLVQMALSQLADSDLVELDTERKASMVSNLMVVLSGDHSPTPVINTGTLYS